MGCCLLTISGPAYAFLSPVPSRRYYINGSEEPLRPVATRLIAIILTSVGFSTSYNMNAPIPVFIVFLALWWVGEGGVWSSSAADQIPRQCIPGQVSQ
jgi:hypothetical protein